jgi:mannose-6-phosphate isomerase-like protein (cupin superfamily)
VGLVSTLLWVTDETPTPLSDTDTAEREIGTPPPLGGSIFRILEIPPQGERSQEELERMVANTLAEQEKNPLPGIHRNPSVRATGMHRTESIDYALVLEGEIDLLLDEDETHLEAGDVVVMQGTYHSWHNRGAGPCMMAFILIGADVPWK